MKQVLTTKTRPDAFLYRPAAANRGTPEYIILEVKYCRDSDPSPQLERAQQQHADLAQAIRQAAPEAQVTYLALLLGVAGTIYTTHTIEPLKKVGIHGLQLNNLVNRLNEHAVNSLHWIYTTKRKQERTQLPKEDKRARKRRKCG